jgi:predicted DNA-binding WGR domain protein
VQASLFDEHTVICGWGRRGTAQARWKIIPVENQNQANELEQRIVAAKLKKGYCMLI